MTNQDSILIKDKSNKLDDANLIKNPLFDEYICINKLQTQKNGFYDDVMLIF
jgi:hypothetical protein